MFTKINRIFTKFGEKQRSRILENTAAYTCNIINYNIQYYVSIRLRIDTIHELIDTTILLYINKRPRSTNRDGNVIAFFFLRFSIIRDHRAVVMARKQCNLNLGCGGASINRRASL